MTSTKYRTLDFRVATRKFTDMMDTDNYMQARIAIRYGILLAEQLYREQLTQTANSVIKTVTTLGIKHNINPQDYMTKPVQV